MGLASDGQSHWTLEMMLSISQKYHVESSLCLATCDFANRHSIRDYSSSGQTDPVNADIARGSMLQPVVLLSQSLNFLQCPHEKHGPPSLLTGPALIDGEEAGHALTLEKVRAPRQPVPYRAGKLPKPDL